MFYVFLSFFWQIITRLNGALQKIFHFLAFKINIFHTVMNIFLQKPWQLFLFIVIVALSEDGVPFSHY